MKNFATLALSSVLAMSACQGGTDASSSNLETTNVVEAPTIKAALIYADWCGSCKVLDPKVKATKQTYTGTDVKFITLDYTDKDTEKFYANAEKHGISDALSQAMNGAVKTGQMFVINTKTNEIVATIKKNKTEAEILSAIRKAAS